MNVEPSSDYFGQFGITPIYTTIFAGSLNIRASREFFPIEVRSPEIDDRVSRAVAGSSNVRG